MYIHLSSNTTLKTDNIIGIFDIENTTVSKHTRNFLYSFNKSSEVITLGDDIPKSFILYCKDKINKKNNKFIIYMMSLSAKTLEKSLSKGEFRNV